MYRYLIVLVVRYKIVRRTHNPGITSLKGSFFLESAEWEEITQDYQSADPSTLPAIMIMLLALILVMDFNRRDA